MLNRRHGQTFFIKVPFSRDFEIPYTFSQTVRINLFNLHSEYLLRTKLELLFLFYPHLKLPWNIKK